MNVIAKTKETIVSKFPLITNYVVSPLKHIGIEITNICNLKCKMCYANRQPKGFMNFELFKKIISELPKSVLGIGLCLGGESLLHKDFDLFLKYLKQEKPNIIIGLNTNGMLLNKHLSAILNLDWICISLDGFANTNDYQRVGANYKKIHTNIMLLLQNKHNDKPRIRLNMVIVKQNKDELMKYYKYWLPKVDEINFSHCFSEKGIYDKESILQFEPTNKMFCHEPFGYMAITYDGIVVPCCHDSNTNNIMGDVTKQTISEVWYSKKFRDLRYACANRDFHNFPHCLNCEIWKYFPLKTFGSSTMEFV